MALAFLPLVAVIGVGPIRIAHGHPGPLDNALAQKARTRITPVDPGRFAAALGDGRDPSVLL